MKTIVKIVLLGIIYYASSCSCQDSNINEDELPLENEVYIHEELPSKEMYTNEEVGWTIEIPHGWSIIAKDKLEERKDDGLEMIKEAGTVLDDSRLKFLLCLQKGQSIFQSSTDPFKPGYEGQWEENYADIKDVLYKTFINEGINVDTSSAVIEVDGLAFNTYHVTAYNSSGKAILYQDMYRRYINGYTFAVAFSYTNSSDKKKLMDIWTNSKFKKVD